MTVAYTTRFSTKRKTLGLTVHSDYSVVVDAPEGTDEAVIEDFISRKKSWLRLKLQDKKPASPPRLWVSGRGLMYKGKSYRLEVVDSLEKPLIFKHKFIVRRNELSEVDKYLVEWYSRQAESFMAVRLSKLAEDLGVSYLKFVVADLKKSWGSCSVKGTITINWRVIKAPVFVINYVLVHELAHLIQLNHSKEFWTIVSIQLPKYKQAKQWLKENGEKLW
jgi:predicted metal-dependent hydrolase